MTDQATLQNIANAHARLRRQRREAGASSTHASPEEIRHALRITPLERLLLWLAKADIYVLRISTYHSRTRLVGLGLMVVFTGLMAFASSTYTLSSALIDPESSYGGVVVVLLALIYTLAIIIIDREIVGATSTSFTSVLTRFVFAVFIAFAVSYPVKLKFFEGRIEVEIDEMIEEQLQDEHDRADEIRARADARKEQELQNLQTALLELNKEAASALEEYNEERDLDYCGPLCTAAGNRLDAAKLQIERTQERIAALGARPALTESERLEIDALDSKISDARRISYDILTKAEAMDRIEAEGGQSVMIVSWFITLFFFLLELVPLALKWSLGSTEYHYYIEARNSLNKQKIVSVANTMIELLQNKDYAFMAPRDMTDYIAYILEDEAMPVKEPDEYYESLADALSMHLSEQNYPDSSDTRRDPAPDREYVEPRRGVDDITEED
jgi:hypothetical protein